MNVQGGNCDCPINSVLINDTCIANEGFFIKLSEIWYYAQECDPSCKSCTAGGEKNCLTCSDPSKTAVLGTCDLNCSSGFYFFNETCFPCQPLCLECYNLTNCSTCVSNSFYKVD